MRPDCAAEDLDQLLHGEIDCGRNSGPLQPEISKAIAEGDLVATAVLSGNRNFEGRISPDVRANYLASPPLVVAYAIAGTMDIDIVNDPIAQTADGLVIPWAKDGTLKVNPAISGTELVLTVTARADGLPSGTASTEPVTVLPVPRGYQP